MKGKKKFNLYLSLWCICISLSFSVGILGEELANELTNIKTVDRETVGNTDDLSKFNYEEDAQYMFMEAAGEQLIARCEDGYYIRMNDILYFADLELENVVPLCYQADCVHQAETKLERSKCNAYVGDQKYAPSVSYANGSVYITGNFDIVHRKQFWDFAQRTFQLSENGVDKRVIEALPVGIENATVVHRGYYYYSYSIYEPGNDGVVKQLCIIARLPIEGGEEEVIYTSDELFVSDLIPYKEYVYFTYKVKGERTHFVYLTETKELKIMNEPVEDNLYYEYMIEGDHLLWRGMRVTDLTEKGWEILWRSDLDGTNMEMAFSQENLEDWDGEELITGTDGTWFYRDTRPLILYIDGNEVIELEEDRELLYYDRETLEYVGSVNLGRQMGWNLLFLGDDKYIFFENYPDYPNKEKSQICYIRKDEMMMGNAEIHILITGERYDNTWYSEYE